MRLRPPAASNGGSGGDEQQWNREQWKDAVHNQPSRVPPPHQKRAEPLHAADVARMTGMCVLGGTVGGALYASSRSLASAAPHVAERGLERGLGRLGQSFVVGVVVASGAYLLVNWKH